MLVASSHLAPTVRCLGNTGGLIMLTTVESMEQMTHSDSVTVNASARVVFDVVSDIGRTGEWSPTCVRCEWDDPEQRGVGATFTGYNETPVRAWQTTSTIIAAEPEVRFAWEVGKGFVRWSYDLRTVGSATELTQTWTFLTAGLDHFAAQYGDQASAEVERRQHQAIDDIPKSLAMIKTIAEMP